MCYPRNPSPPAPADWRQRLAPPRTRTSWLHPLTGVSGSPTARRGFAEPPMRVVGRFLTRRQGAPAWMRGQFAEVFDRVAPTQPASTAPCTARFARAASWVAERCAGGRRWPGRSTHSPRWPAPAPATARANQPVAAGQFPVECGGWCATLDENRLFPLANQGGVQPLHSHHPMKPDAS
jgi:hypothetical protein